MNDTHVIRFDRAICGDLDAAARREWWLANGRGAYAAGTISHTLTRRYHGLLVAPVVPPLGRMLVFAKADATLEIDGRALPLFTNCWSDGAIDPRGHVHIESFELDGRIPVWRYAFGGATLEQRIWMEQGANTVYVAFRLAGAPPAAATLELRLLVNARDHHGETTHRDVLPEMVADPALGSLALRHAGAPEFSLRFLARGGAIAPDRTWYRNFDLALERERGLPASDSHLCVGAARLDLGFGDWVGIVASTEREASPYLSEALRRARVRDTSALRRVEVLVPEMRRAPPWIKRLALAAEDFVFARPLPDFPDGVSVIAGYPWFGDWGRDTMIALPGLLLATGRYDTARRILETFARFVDRGMLPNVFPAAGAVPEYNTVDAALWYVEAWRAWFECTGDRRTLAANFTVLGDIVAAYRAGTRHGIGVDPADGLLRAGERGVQLTWMDAKLGDRVVTPRLGKPVEINALWYNALATMAELAECLGREDRSYREDAARVKSAFRRFDRADAGLYDVIDGPDGDDAAIRPNQILAASLHHSPLDPARRRAVVAECAAELLCSHGLRSLSPRDPAYRGRYEGGVAARDSSYHQGPVWPWLLAHFIRAELAVTGDVAAAKARLAPLGDHLADAGLGTVSEIFDGDPPHAARGAPAQAWSVAAALEAWWRITQAEAAADAPVRFAGGAA
ncbi:MAG: glycogen debranching enzyme family protein [Gammaproteobacteria bacterium]|nr:glycogen debranching enzyme family protein [Gammaproteobacteria bacterium]